MMKKAGVWIAVAVFFGLMAWSAFAGKIPTRTKPVGSWSDADILYADSLNANFDTLYSWLQTYLVSVDSGATDDQTAAEIDTLIYSGSLRKIVLDTLITAKLDSANIANVDSLTVTGLLDLNADIDSDRWLSGFGNTFIGQAVAGAGNLVTATGDSSRYNTAYGDSALYSITKGWMNTALGYRALYTDTLGYRNIAIGKDAHFGGGSSYSNIAIGVEAAYSGPSNDAIAIGDSALYTSTTFRNIAIGSNALRKSTSGTDQVAIGNNALNAGGIIGTNVAIGSAAGKNVPAGTGNVFLGYQAGMTDSSTSNSVFLGNQAGKASLGTGNELYIANTNTATPLIYGNFTNGNVGIGATSFGTAAKFVLAIGGGTTIPSSSPANMIQLYADTTGGVSAELKVRDEGGTVTTLSPHKFKYFEPPVEAGLPWSYYSFNEYTGKEINVDMWKLAKLVEQLTGEQIIYEVDLPPERRKTQADWDTEQTKYQQKRNREIEAWERQENEYNEQMAQYYAGQIDEKPAPIMSEKPKRYKPKTPPKWIKDRMTK